MFSDDQKNLKSHSFKALLFHRHKYRALHEHELFYYSGTKFKYTYFIGQFRDGIIQKLHISLKKLSVLRITILG